MVEPRPVVEWRAIPGITRYRVQLESRVPEGRVLTSTDSITAGTRFVPPADLTDSRAAVKIRVTAACEGEPSRVAEQTAWFFIDRSPACPAVEKLSFPGPGKVEWTRAAAATRYEIVFYEVPQGKVVAGGETVAASYAIPGGSEPLLVAVKPRCGAALGPAVYGLLPATR